MINSIPTVPVVYQGDACRYLIYVAVVGELTQRYSTKSRWLVVLLVLELGWAQLWNNGNDSELLECLWKLLPRELRIWICNVVNQGRHLLIFWYFRIVRVVTNYGWGICPTKSLRLLNRTARQTVLCWRENGQKIARGCGRHRERERADSSGHWKHQEYHSTPSQAETTLDKSVTGSRPIRGQVCTRTEFINRSIWVVTSYPMIDFRGCYQCGQSDADYSECPLKAMRLRRRTDRHSIRGACLRLRPDESGEPKRRKVRPKQYFYYQDHEVYSRLCLSG